MDNYRPQLFLRTADITTSLHWPEGTEGAAEKMVMPGDNVEMVCDLVHDAAAEVGTRFTLREGGKTSKHSYPIFPIRGPYGYSQLEPVLLHNSSRWLKLSALCPSLPQSTLLDIHAREPDKSFCWLLPLMLSSVFRNPPLTKSRNIASGAYVHTYIIASPKYLYFAHNWDRNYSRTSSLDPE